MEIGTNNPVDQAMINIENSNFPNEELKASFEILRKIVNKYLQ